MPIKATPSLEEAVDEFIESYRLHLRATSNARFIDPRECKACIETFEAMVVARRSPRPQVVPDDVDEDDNKIVRLWP